MKALTTSLLALTTASLLGAADNKQPATGYTDTPFLPDGKWRVHDDNRPRPQVVTPGATFSHGAPAPSDATILFDGTSLDGWVNTKPGKPVTWKIIDNFMEVTPKSGTLRTKGEFGDFQLHLEFATPAKVVGASQGRGNSGVIIYGKYEVQLLDSHNNKTYADGQCGAMYGQFPPLRNAAKAPGQWQSYDIIFESARWDGNKLTKKANVTVIHNGVLLHHRNEFIGTVKHKRVADYKAKHEPKGPIVLQDHGNPMRFRNIWIREIGNYDESAE
jgi:hypothetical protein